jgi:ABC-type transport system involved in cytochrome c biogenesis permease component
VRWLLQKDLKILARSRLLLVVLIVYPIAIALLIGLAISRSPGKQTVAIVDETPPGQTVEVGGKRVEVSKYAEELFNQVQSVSVPSRAQAIKEIESGKVLAAVVIPADIASRIATGVSPGSVEVLYNGNALEQSIVRSQLGSALAQANLGFSEQLQRAAAQVIDSLLKGGNISILGAPTLVGLDQISPQLRAIIARQPPGADRAALERIAAFSGFAAQNLGIAKSALSTIGQPIQVKNTVVQGRRTPLDSFAVVVAVSVSLMFVSVLLAAGGVAIEREEHALPRLARGLVSREGILVEKGLLASSCSLPLAFAMLAGIGAFVSLEWSRVGLWLLALVFGALAFAALGVAIGALVREVRAASLLAFLLSLPLAFLALVPAGSVASGVEAVINAISFVFPFKAALQALDTAVNGASPSIGVSLLHLFLLTLLFGALARAGLRRLD